jgi:hypothetical protein
VSGAHDASLGSASAWSAALTWITDRFGGAEPEDTCTAQYGGFAGEPFEGDSGEYVFVARR